MRRPRVLLAWCVHLYTALGLGCAAAIAVLLSTATPDSVAAFRWSFVLMAVATLFDATDGTMARAVRIKEVLPGFDGRKLDDLVDFLTYTCLPLLLVWRAGLLPEGWRAWLLLPLLASAYGFCQVSAKTADGYFLGFPSYWNLVAFYLYALQPLSGWLTVALVVVPALLTFVPSRYLYTTQRGRLNRVTNLLAGVWVGLVVWILWRLPDEALSPASEPGRLTRGLALLSLFFPAFYLAASWLVTFKVWRRRRRRAEDPFRAALAAEK